MPTTKKWKQRKSETSAQQKKKSSKKQPAKKPTDNSLGYSREQLADELGICDRTLDNWCAEEDGPPFVQFQRRKFFPRAQLEAWIAENLQ